MNQRQAAEYLPIVEFILISYGCDKHCGRFPVHQSLRVQADSGIRRYQNGPSTVQSDRVVAIGCLSFERCCHAEWISKGSMNALPWRIFSQWTVQQKWNRKQRREQIMRFSY